METEQLHTNGRPLCPTTNYENDNAAQRLGAAETLLDEIAERVATRLLEKTDIAEWAKQAAKPAYTAAETGADPSGSAQRALQDAKEYSDGAYRQATGYTDTAIARLIGSAQTTLDTLEEIARAMSEHDNVVQALETAVGLKASETEFQSHAGNKTVHVTASDQERWNKAAASIPSAPEDIGALPADASAVSADKWKTPRNINGMNVDGSGNRTNYGTCSTPAATAAKVVSCTGFGLVTGAEITVRFTVTNTAANPTLNVNGTGAKPVYYRGAAMAAGYLAANRTYMFRYNGTRYELVGDIDTSEKYAAMTGATASAAGKSGLVPAPGAGKQNAYLRGDGLWVTPATTLTGTVAGIPLDQTMGKKLDDKISVINSNLSRKIAEITPDKYVSKIFFRKNGNTVTILLEKSTSEITLMNETMVIGKVPEGFRPLAYVSTMLLLTLNAVPAYFAINSLGDIAIRIRGNIQADIMLYAAFTYVI